LAIKATNFPGNYYLNGPIFHFPEEVSIIILIKLAKEGIKKA